MTSTLSPSQRRDWVRLARTEMVGAVSFAFLIKRYGNPTKALENLPTGFQGREREAASAIPSREEVEAELEAGAPPLAQGCCYLVTPTIQPIWLPWMHRRP